MRLDAGNVAHDLSPDSDSEGEPGPCNSGSALQELMAVAKKVKSNTDRSSEDNATKVGSLLSLLKKQVDAEAETADYISDNLAEIIQAMFKYGLSETEVKEKSEKHLRPKNCDMVATARVNQLLWDKLPSSARSADVKIQNILKVLTKGVVPLVKIADKMLKVMLGKQEMPAEQDLFLSLTDSIGLLATASHSLNMRRREAMMPELNADFQCLKSKNVPLTTHLFGNELEKTLEDISKANRVGKKVDKRRKHQFNHSSRRGFHHQRGAFKASSSRGEGSSHFHHRRGPFSGHRHGKPPSEHKKQGERKKQD